MMKNKANVSPIISIAYLTLRIVLAYWSAGCTRLTPKARSLYDLIAFPCNTIVNGRLALLKFHRASNPPFWLPVVLSTGITLPSKEGFCHEEVISKLLLVLSGIK